MTPHEDTLQAAIRANVPVLLRGVPGVGKTARVRAAARAFGWPLYEVIASIREPADFGGFPVPTNGHVRLVPSGEWNEFVAEVEKAGAGLLFLDEISSVPPATQAALMRVVLDRRVGELQLPRSTRVVCAANPAAMAAGGWDLAAPLANRLLHLEWPVPSVDAWSEWLLTESVLPEGEEPRWAGAPGHRVRALLTGFLHHLPNLLLDVPEDEEGRGRAWPSPRSYEACARALAEVVDPHPEKLSLEKISGVAAAAVGSGAASALVSWARDADLPDPEAVLANPSAWEVDPLRQDRVWATLGGVYAAVVSRLDAERKVPKDRWQRVWEVYLRADTSGAAAAGVAALAIPLSKVAAPGGPAYRLPVPPGAEAAFQVRQAAMGDAP